MSDIPVSEQHRHSFVWSGTGFWLCDCGIGPTDEQRRLLETSHKDPDYRELATRLYAQIDELQRLRTAQPKGESGVICEACKGEKFVNEWRETLGLDGRPDAVADCVPCFDCNGTGRAPSPSAVATSSGEGERQVIQSVYTRSGKAVVCGIPDESHNCDEMACSSVEHILWRGPHIVDEKPARDPMTDWRNGENMAVQNKRPSFDELVDVVTGEPLHPMKRTYGGVTREQFEAAKAAASAPAKASGAFEAGWQPIETAPKDGTDIETAYKNCDSWFRHTSFWITDEDDPEESGWWSYTLSEVTRTKLDGPFAPTHWRPLPPAPYVSAESEGAGS